MTAEQLVTVRGERSRWFGGATPGLLGTAHVPERADRPVHRRPHGRRGPRARLGATPVPNRRPWRAATWPATTATSPTRPASCPPPATGQPWVKPMTLAEFRRQGELSLPCRPASAALADADAGRPPAGANGRHLIHCAGTRRSGRRRRSHARSWPARFAARLQRLGLWQGHHGQRQRPAAGQPAFPVGRRQPLLAGAPDRPRQPGRHGRGPSATSRWCRSASTRTWPGRTPCPPASASRCTNCSWCRAIPPATCRRRASRRRCVAHGGRSPVRAADGSLQRSRTRCGPPAGARWSCFPRAGLNWTHKSPTRCRTPTSATCAATDTWLGFEPGTRTLGHAQA
jgi:hypothetical protein